MPKKRLSHFGLVERGLVPAGQVYEAFARRLVERHSGDFVLIDGDARRLFDGERNEFLSRADSILSRTHYLEKQVKGGAFGGMIVVALLLTLLLGLLGLEGNRILPVAMIGLAVVAGAVMQVPLLMQRREMAALEARLRRRVASRETLPDALVVTAKDINPWVRATQIAAALAVVIVIAAMIGEGGGLTSTFSTNGIDANNLSGRIMATGLPFVCLAYVFFLLGRLREWRNKSRHHRQRGTMALSIDYATNNPPVDRSSLTLDDPLWEALAHDPDRQ